MTVTGYQFDKAKVTALHDSILYHQLAHQQSFVLRGMGSEMAVTTSGLRATVDTGVALICGRMVEITEAETVDIPANSRGYLVIYIDLSVENTVTGIPGEASYEVQNNQVSVRFVTNLTQQDLLQGGLIYTFNLGRIETNTSSVVRFVPEKTLGQPAQLYQLTNLDGTIGGGAEVQDDVWEKDGTFFKWRSGKYSTNPTGTEWGMLQNWHLDTKKAIQLFYSIGGRVFLRQSNDSSKWSFGNWKEFVFSNHKNLVNTGWISTGVAGVYYKRVADVVTVRINVQPRANQELWLGSIPQALLPVPYSSSMFRVASWTGDATVGRNLQINDKGGMSLLADARSEKVVTSVTWII